MKRDLTLAMSALAVLLASTAFADVEEITDIDVTLDLSAIQNEAAAAYWSNLELDRETGQWPLAGTDRRGRADDSESQPGDYQRRQRGRIAAPKAHAAGSKAWERERATAPASAAR